MYFSTIQQFKKTLKNLDEILAKAISHAENKKFDANNFCLARLAPDMFTLTRQVQIACDVAKYAGACLSDQPAPKHEDQEQTLLQLRERISQSLNYLDSLKPEHFNHLTAKTIIKVNYPVGKAMYAEEFLLSRAIPNFFFHVTTTYALLRAGGVDVGKGDFLGQQNLFNA